MSGVYVHWYAALVLECTYPDHTQIRCAPNGRFEFAEHTSDGWLDVTYLVRMYGGAVSARVLYTVLSDYQYDATCDDCGTVAPDEIQVYREECGDLKLCPECTHGRHTDESRHNNPAEFYGY